MAQFDTALEYDILWFTHITWLLDRAVKFSLHITEERGIMKRKMLSLFLPSILAPTLASDVQLQGL